MNDKAKKKILMIDDNTFYRKIYKNQLTHAGYQFLEASNGQEGLHKIINEQPDLVLLDLMMPMMNGFEVLRAVRANDKIKKIPIIILSNLEQEQDIEEGLDLGAVDYIVKLDLKMSSIMDKIKKKLQ